jgi:tetratricopeptide (TPR) repeat protein
LRPKGYFAIATLLYYLRMRKSEQFVSTLAATILLLFVVAPGVSAQTDPRNPAMASQRFDRDKEALYAIFTDNRRSTSPAQRQRAYEAARKLLLRYGGDHDSYESEAKKFVADFEKEVSQSQLYIVYSEKNYAKTFELGRPLLKNDPDNFFVLGVLAEAGYENALAGNSSLNEETIDYLRRAIKLLEAGMPAKADPFKSVDMAGGFLNLGLGWFLKDKAPVEAAAAFGKAVQAKSPYHNDPLTYYRLGVTILKGEFAQLSAEYNETYGTKPSSAEQQAMLERILQAGGRAIDAYARAIALSDPKGVSVAAGQTQFTPEFRGKVLEQLTALYKNLHNDSDAGLDELISSVLAKRIP